MASPFLSSLPLDEHGLEWCWPEIDLAHPLDRGTAGVLVRSLDDTAEGLGPDGDAWRATFGHLARHFDEAAEDLLRPILHLPHHPVLLARFGMAALQPATLLARRFHTAEARALYGGVAAHVIHPLDRPTTAALGMMLTASCHHVGWPVARGGSRAITDALASLLRSLGGTIETGADVRSLGDLPAATVSLFDCAPGPFAAIAGDALPHRIRRAYRRYRHGPAAFKVGPGRGGRGPVDRERPRAAGTVHVGGTIEEVAASERATHSGTMPERPFVLVAQQSLPDPSRAAGDVHPVWTYAHVPVGFTGDATEAIVGQLERFAPVSGTASWGCTPAARPPSRREPQLRRGRHLHRRQRPLAGGHPAPPRARSLRTGIPGVFLCSAATPPAAACTACAGPAPPAPPSRSSGADPPGATAQTAVVTANTGCRG